MKIILLIIGLAMLLIGAFLSFKERQPPRDNSALPPPDPAKLGQRHRASWEKTGQDEEERLRRLREEEDQEDEKQRLYREEMEAKARLDMDQEQKRRLEAEEQERQRQI